eukprot:TRINITY_DN8647_c0_g1_i2.p1 TRINITY_DN8647_c0_g1~~TRINITY_DN8647_c0_g1_i2.p1  ORF type:complete len:162 (+),score=15.87 TRINITY_DN8647_c0_g1_i2:62-547(+)
MAGVSFFFFFKQKTAYEIMPSLVGSEMCIRDRYMGSGINAEYMGQIYHRGAPTMFDQPASGKNKPAVLVIAPSAANRQQICECLYQLPDIRTVATGDGKQALTIIQETWPSMVLLDDALQGIDGISLTRTIRTLEQSRDEGVRKLGIRHYKKEYGLSLIHI